MRRHFDTATALIIIITLGLFGLALVEKGITHDLLLEAGVFLVSAKLVMAAYKSSVAQEAVLSRLDGLARAVDRLEQHLHRE